MRHNPPFLLLLVALAAFLLPACTSDNHYAAEMAGTGNARAQAFHVVDGEKQAITKNYTAQGEFAATVQTVKPYLTLDGTWTTDAAGMAEEPGAVLIRPLPARGPQPGDVVAAWVVEKDGTRRAIDVTSLAPGAGMDCEEPAAAPPAAEPDCESSAVPPPVSLAEPPAAPAADDCGRDIYCPPACGTSNPENRRISGDLDPRFPAPKGPGWPCNKGASLVPGATAVLKGAASVAIVPFVFAGHVGECFVNFLKCVVGG